MRAAQGRGLEVTPAERLTNHLGKGLTAEVEGRTIAIGTPELFTLLDLTPPTAALARVISTSVRARCTSAQSGAFPTRPTQRS